MASHCVKDSDRNPLVATTFPGDSHLSVSPLRVRGLLLSPPRRFLVSPVTPSASPLWVHTAHLLRAVQSPGRGPSSPSSFRWRSSCLLLLISLPLTTAPAHWHFLGDTSSYTPKAARPPAVPGSSTRHRPPQPSLPGGVTVPIQPLIPPFSPAPGTAGKQCHLHPPVPAGAGPRAPCIRIRSRRLT